MLFDKIHLEESETIITTVRKHWFIIFVELVSVALLALLPILALGMYMQNEASAQLLPQTTISTPLFIFAASLWLVMTSLLAMVLWTHYYLDLWVVTDRRIIVIEQISLWHRTVGNFRLERLQDIQVTVRGIIPTLLNYGTVHAQTASAAESNFTTTGLPDPRGLQSIIQSAMDARLKSLNHTTIAN